MARLPLSTAAAVAILTCGGEGGAVVAAPCRPASGGPPVIAYVRDRDRIDLGVQNQSDIYVARVQRNRLIDAIRLTSAPGNDFSPAWSPDGSKIAFRSSRDGNDEIYVMSADGSAQTNLTKSPDEEDRSPAWSPDGKRIAFASEVDHDLSIYVMNADGTRRRRLTSRYGGEEYPTWSPDGRKIAFHAFYRDDLELAVIDASGRNRRRLTKRSGEDSFPVWSPDGERILFTSNRGARADLFTMRPDGSRVKRLTNHPAVDAFASWCPDGSRIAFTSDRRSRTYGELDFQLYVANADGSRVQRLDRTGGGTALQPVWRP